MLLIPLDISSFISTLLNEFPLEEQSYLHILQTLIDDWVNVTSNDILVSIGGLQELVLKTDTKNIKSILSNESPTVVNEVKSIIEKFKDVCLEFYIFKNLAFEFNMIL